MKVKNGRRVFEAENWRQEIRGNTEGGPDARTGSCSYPNNRISACVCVCGCVRVCVCVCRVITRYWLIHLYSLASPKIRRVKWQARDPGESIV